MSEGMEWRTINEARKFFKNLAIRRKFSYQEVKNDNRRLKLKCKDKDCKWIHASVLSDKVTVRLRYFSTEHICQADENNKYAQAKTPWCRTELEDCLRAHPHFKPQDLIDEIFSRYGVELSYWTAWNIKCQLKGIINGTFEDGYKKVAELARQIKMKNEGSVVNWYKDEDTGEFTRLIIAFKASLDGFVSGCRPLIGLDGAHLKGKYGGCVLTAMALDAQNRLFPLAIFVCNGENKAAWSRMLGVLQQYIWKHPEEVTFTSDRQKGLVDAIKQLFPGQPQRYCFRHMYENFKLAGHKGDELKLLSYGAAKAYREAEYLRIMAILERDFPEAKKWLEKEELKTWTRHNFDLTCKSDAITNNPCESFNAWILKIRDKPLIQFVDMYTLALMGLVYDRRMLSMELDEYGLVPYAEHIIERLSQKYNRYKIQGVAERIYCVINSKNGKKFDVDLSKLTCSCIIWQMTGIPCVHTCAVIRPRREGWVRYCSPYYTVKKFRATYAGYIFPIANEDNWNKVSDAEAVLPPPRVIAPGRPKKLRMKGAEEDIGTRKGNRECSKCKGYGHNATTCDRRKKAAEKLSKGKNVKKRVMEEDTETSTQGEVRGRCGRTGSGGRATRGGRGTKGGRSSRGGRSTQATDSSQDLSQVIQSKPARATRGGKGKRGKHN